MVCKKYINETFNELNSYSSEFIKKKIKEHKIGEFSKIVMQAYLCFEKIDIKKYVTN